MDRLLNSHWVVKITAFLIALMMYTTVYNDDSLVESDNNTNLGGDTLPKTVELIAKYDEEKYELMGKPDRIKVEFTGSQADLTNFELKREPTAFIDLTGKGPGQYNVSIKIPNVPDNIDVHFIDETITVTLHEKTTETFPVTVQLINEDKLPKGYIAGDPELEIDEITITGAKELIDEIAYIRGFVNVSDTKDTIIQEVKLQAYNKDFDPIEIEFDPEVIEVTVPIDNPNKEVPISVDEQGTLAEDLELISATLSEEEISVYAPEAVLDELSEINIPIDLSKITEDTTIEVDVPLPEGAFYSTPGKVSVEIDVGQVEETSTDGDSQDSTASSRTFSDLAIQIRGLSESEQASFIEPQSGIFELTVKGNEEDLQSLSKDDIVAFVDVESLEKGQHDVEIQVDVPDQFTFERKLSEATLTISNRSA
ncbi:YbbR-like domain-containing protein [Alkalihalobacillus sp. AL-G]|uniref:CdaR family protein n=1 Tax=Alkalihalobacillus sp. AL-G TaxID=2926399 RepID=UPI00272DB44E|nr:CdaR family protein [Alkalihalobacillus sp. AL-G]WLD93575.1 CdaR family protein [Alkalihalobacillus sp. AL-G]